MEQEQTGSKWNRIVQHLKDTDDEGDQDSNAEDEENDEIDKNKSWAEQSHTQDFL